MTLTPTSPHQTAEEAEAPPSIGTERTGSPTGPVIFVFVPLAALLIALPIAMTGVLPLTWLDLALAVVFYLVTAIGITVGFHRYFTHASFKTNGFMRWLLGAAGSLAIQGRISDWVGDHRKHHAFSDKDGDPHSPWRFGTRHGDVAKGLWFAHMGWFFSPSETDVSKYAPDILADPVTRSVSRWFPAFVVASLVGPAVLGGLITWSWMGALSAFFWAGLVRVALLHQVTWSINSLTHVFGKQPFRSRDESRNLAWLSVLSVGESWHNYHHADPTSARIGVLRNQVDVGAMTISTLERLRLIRDVRWPSQDRVEKRLKDPSNPPTLHRRIQSR